MIRVHAHMETLVTAPARLAFAVAAARSDGLDDQVRVRVVETEIETREIECEYGTRMHIVDAPTGLLSFDYEATCLASATQEVSDFDLVTFIRPSRYVESDDLGHIARKMFAGLTGFEAVEAVRSWVATNILYVSGSSKSTDSATDTYFQMQGVCRDFAHLTAAFLRAIGLPARLTSVYAPGLRPMDFHAVTEVAIDGTWYVVDATGLAPRASMVRIATGRDAADTAFLTTLSGRHTFKKLSVGATMDDPLPTENPSEPVVLGRHG